MSQIKTGGNMNITLDEAIQILEDHGEVPEHHMGREEQGFYHEVGEKDYYTIDEVRDYLGY